MRPDLRFVLIEPKRRRLAFLELAVEELALANVVIFPGRVEDAGTAGPFEVVTARAFAPAVDSWRRCRHLLRPAGRLLYFAGASWRSGADRQQLLHAGAEVEICGLAGFPWQGPVVMMTPISAV
jgi:16S rRNA (guanine527-N7)-methyltransferase